MSYSALITLAELHFGLGLIGTDEFRERCDVAAWVFGKPGFETDPRDEKPCSERPADEHAGPMQPAASVPAEGGQSNSGLIT